MDEPTEVEGIQYSEGMLDIEQISDAIESKLENDTLLDADKICRVAVADVTDGISFIQRTGFASPRQNLKYGV